MKNSYTSPVKIFGYSILALAMSLTSRALATDVPVVNGTFDEFASPITSSDFSLNGNTGGYLYGTLGAKSGFTYGGGATGPLNAATSIAGFTGTNLTINGFADVADFGSNYVGAGTSSGLFADFEQSAISETLTSDVLPNTLYTLNFAAAYRKDQQNPGTQFSVELLAGSTLLQGFVVGDPTMALATSNSPSLGTTFQNYSIDYAITPADSALYGEPLTIRFASNEAVTDGSHQILVDNVSLDQEGIVVPEPSTYAFLILGMGTLLAAARFRRVS